MKEALTINHKALRINLDPNFYGTFAEIGAGQEVARNFFKVGGASGTVAKAMSAYDMIFSDAIYGTEEDGRYVSRSRLVKMLTHECELIQERLKGEKYEQKRYFVFANTVTTINYSKTNEAHGWLGVRFQTIDDGPFNDVILHVRLLDSDGTLQQNVLGDLGVNLIYACYQYAEDPKEFLASLSESLPRQSIEIDMLSMTGPSFAHIDNRLISLILVAKGYSKVACFMPDGQVVQPKDFLYKKNVCVLRARFKPFTNLNQDMITQGMKLFTEDHALTSDQAIAICEVTINNLLDTGSEVDLQDFLDRAEIICKLGYPVLISSYAEHNELALFLKQCKPKHIGIILGVMNLLQILKEDRYQHPASELLLQFGQLFSSGIAVYAYPCKVAGQEKVMHFSDVKLAESLQGLIDFIHQQGLIHDIKEYNPFNLSIQSSEIVKQIMENKPGWEECVPEKVAQLVKENCLFDYPCEIDTRRKRINQQYF